MSVSTLQLAQKQQTMLRVLILTILSGVSQLAVAQCIEGNCKNGQGTYIYDSGAKYVGQYKNGKINGTGTLYFSNGNRYTGQWKNNYREGRGRLAYDNGDVYQGEFSKSKLAGEGVMTYANGDKYEGKFADDKPHGKGKLTYRNKDVYTGQFKGGKLEGEGTMTYADGSSFTGQWKHNFKDGPGTLTAADGSITEGLWLNGKYVEEETVAEAVHDEDGHVDMEEIAELVSEPIRDDMEQRQALPDCTYGNCDGIIGIYKYRDGSKYVGEFKNGKPEGEGKCYYKNGDKYVGEWKRHAPHGEGTMYFSTGRVVGAVWSFGRAVKELRPNEVVPSRHQNIDRDDKVKVWAVIVGVGRYAHMPVLKYTDDDAYQVYAFLKSPEGGALPDDQMRILIDEDATREKILTAMQQTFLRADENDVVLLYFSGHGVKGAFIPVDFDGFNNQLSHKDLKDIFEQSQAKHKLCFADACHSGSMLAARSVGSSFDMNRYYQELERTKGGMALMMSSKSEEVSLEDRGLRQGIFSHYLIRGLKGEADDDKNKVVTVDELFNYVHSSVRRYTLGSQTPTLTGTYDKLMPVSIVR